MKPGRAIAIVRRIAALAFSAAGLGAAFGGSRRYRRDLELVEQSGLFDAQWYLSAYPDVAGAGLDPLRHFMTVGWRESRAPGPMFTTSKYLRANPDVADTGMNPLLHFIQFGIAEGRDGFGDRHATIAAQVTSFAGMGEPSACLSFPRNPIEPLAWMTSRDFDPKEPTLLSVDGTPLGFAVDTGTAEATNRAVDRLKQLSGAPVEGATSSPADGPQYRRLIDVWYLDVQRLRMRWSSDDAFPVVRVYQVDPHDSGRLRLVGEGAAGDELETVEARLLNPYFPLLVIFSRAAGEIRGHATIGFPSLCRGGVHYAELLWAMQQGATDRRAIDDRLTRDLLALRCGDARPAVRRVTTDGSPADGNGTLFQPDFRLWLRTVFGVEVSDSPIGADEAVLEVPPDGVPTLSALLQHRGAPEKVTGMGKLLISRLSPSGPMLFVEVPTGSANLSPPAAIMLSPRNGPSDAELLVPVAPARSAEEALRPAISWLVDAVGSEPQRLREAIHSIGLQQGTSDDCLVLIGGAGEDLRQVASDLFQGEVTACSARADAIHNIRTPLAAMVAPGVLLHDTGTAAELASLLEDDNVATASCVMISAERRSGLLKAAIVDGGAMVTAGGELAAAPDVARAAAELWRRRFPVARPSAPLWAARTDDLRAWSGGAEPAGVHLCTSRVTAVAPRDGAVAVPFPMVSSPARATKIQWLFG